MATTPHFLVIIKRFYDKTIFLVAALFLALGLLALFNGMQTEKASDESFFARLDSLKPEHEKAESASTTSYSNALIRLQRPHRIAIDTNRVVGFFVPETRVWCANRNCTALFSPDVRLCPVCQTEQPGEPTDDPDYDSDGGGCPDWWEIKYGLDPHDPADDRLDSDGDGFDNYAEYLAGTDPKDPKSHPDLLKSLRVEHIETTRLPIKFMGATKLPNGKHRCQINLMGEEGRAGMSHFVLEGDKIGATDFVLVRYIETEEMRLNEMFNREMPFTIKRVEIKRGDKSFILGVDEDSAEADYRITLLQTLDNSRLEVSGDGEITVGEKSYRVIAVDKRASTIVLRSDADAAGITIPKLEN